MKVLYNGKVHETKEVNGLVMSLDEKILFGEVGETLLVGEEVIEEIAEDAPDESWVVADIKAWLDSHDIAYTSSMLKADLLALA